MASLVPTIQYAATLTAVILVSIYVLASIHRQWQASRFGHKLLVKAMKSLAGGSGKGFARLVRMFL